MKAELKTIITISGKEIELTHNEAKTLRDYLNVFFPAEKFVPIAPIVINPEPYQWDPNRVWYSTCCENTACRCDGGK